MTKPVVAVVKPLMPHVMEALDAAFDLVHLWKADDPAALVRAEAHRIRGMAAGLGGTVDKPLLDALPHLEIVANFGVGYDSVDAVYASTRNVIVTNTPDVLTEEVADIAMGLLIMTARELGAAERFVREGRWLSEKFPLTRGTLRGRTLGILGLGRIGRAIALRAEAFGLKIAYHNRRPVEDVDYAYHPSLVALAKAVDTLMVVAPGGAETRHIVNAEVLEALGPEGILINIGRGSVVDEAALAEALDKGTILSAGLDVFETEPCLPQALAAHERVVLLPHVGSASHHTRNLMGQLVVDNLVNWFAKGAPLTPVAETPWPRA